ncbi:hypothetical protein EV421DRAFT_1838256 [Armillaria borealis]|uniref:Uncharacterized protein n=1 Tax=Armillaria borealis TaxID=47425 RepID=A0AA39J2J4_9AGAR|nr:hypothetical protein EV421DRAFT_1838256 [Armillaria borealis]
MTLAFIPLGCHFLCLSVYQTQKLCADGKQQFKAIYKYEHRRSKRRNQTLESRCIALAFMSLLSTSVVSIPNFGKPRDWYLGHYERERYVHQFPKR